MPHTRFQFTVPCMSQFLSQDLSFPICKMEAGIQGPVTATQHHYNRNNKH